MTYQNVLIKRKKYEVAKKRYYNLGEFNREKLCNCTYGSIHKITANMQRLTYARKRLIAAENLYMDVLNSAAQTAEPTFEWLALPRREKQGRKVQRKSEKYDVRGGSTGFWEDDKDGFWNESKDIQAHLEADTRTLVDVNRATATAEETFPWADRKDGRQSAKYVEEGRSTGFRDDDTDNFWNESNNLKADFKADANTCRGVIIDPTSEGEAVKNGSVTEKTTEALCGCNPNTEELIAADDPPQNCELDTLSDPIEIEGDLLVSETNSNGNGILKRIRKAFRRALQRIQSYMRRMRSTSSMPTNIAVDATQEARIYTLLF